MSKEFLLLPIGGVNTFLPSHRIDDEECSIMQNVISHGGKISTFPGSQKYNQTALDDPILWAGRYYGLRSDGSFLKKAFCYSGGAVYVGDETTHGLTSKYSGLSIDCLPESETMQVSGNSIMFLFTAKDYPVYYDGNDSGQWYPSAIDKKVVQGTAWLDRLWVFEENSSVLSYSKNLFPENFTDSTDSADIIIGNDRDSFIRRTVILGDTLYIFKNDGIYYIEGRTPSTFAVRLVTKKYGLAGQRAIGFSGTALMFLNEFDKEWYSFGGTETSINDMSKKIQFSKLINFNKVNNICCIEHKNVFRIAYQPFEQDPANQYNSFEACFPTDEYAKDKRPKWCFSKGANISCYSTWNKQGDQNELVTGRSDAGYLMYHYRGHNWDETAMEIRLRTKDKIYNEGYSTRFPYFIIDGNPVQDSSVTLNWYINSRITGATVGTKTVPLDGEEVAIAAMHFTTQTRFNNVVKPLVLGSLGNSLALEIYANTKGLGFDLYSFIISTEKGNVVRNNLVGG